MNDLELFQVKRQQSDGDVTQYTVQKLVECFANRKDDDDNDDIDNGNSASRYTKSFLY